MSGRLAADQSAGERPSREFVLILPNSPSNSGSTWSWRIPMRLWTQLSRAQAGDLSEVVQRASYWLYAARFRGGTF